MFHHFPEELGVRNCLVRSTRSNIAKSRSARSSSRSCNPAIRAARRPLSDAVAAAAGSLLHVEPAGGFRTVAGFRSVDVDHGEPATICPAASTAAYRLLDLDGEGIAGVLSEQDAGLVLQA